MDLADEVTRASFMAQKRQSRCSITNLEQHVSQRSIPKLFIDIDLSSNTEDTWTKLKKQPMKTIQTMKTHENLLKTSEKNNEKF